MLDRLKLLIRSENTIIALDTRDEVQGVELVRKAAEDMAVPLFEWTVTAGMARTKVGVYNARAPCRTVAGRRE